MKDTQKMKVLMAAALAGLLLAVPGAHASEDARKEMEQARKQLDAAREELRRAARELARSMAKVEKDNPRAQYFEFMTNPKRAVVGIIIDDEANKDDRGVMVFAATPGGGAEQAGIEAGDVLLSMNGQSLAAKDGKRPEYVMHDVLVELKAGDKIKVEYDRGGKRKTTTVTTQAPEPDIALSMLPASPHAFLELDKEDFEPLIPFKQWFRGEATRGLQLCKMDEDLARYFKTRDGVLVIKAPKETSIGLKSGDVIQKIDGRAVSEPVTVMDRLRSRGDGDQKVTLEILRQGKKQTLNASIPVAEASPFEKHRRYKIIIDHDDRVEHDDD